MCRFLKSRFDCGCQVTNSTAACELKLNNYKNPLCAKYPDYRSCPTEDHVFPEDGMCPVCIQKDIYRELRREEVRQHSLPGRLQSLSRGNKDKPLPPIPGQGRDGSGSRPDISWPIPIVIAPRPMSPASDDTASTDDKFFPERAERRAARKISQAAAPSRRARSTVGPPKIPERRSSLPQVHMYAPRDSQGRYIGTELLPKAVAQTIRRKPVPTSASRTDFSYGKRENRINPHVSNMQALSAESSSHTTYESSSSNEDSTSPRQESDLFLPNTEPSSSASSQQQAELFLPNTVEKFANYPSILLPARGRPILKKRNFAVDFAQVPKAHYDRRAPPRIPSLEFDDYPLIPELDHVDPLRSHPVEAVEEWPLRPERLVPVMQRPPPEQCLQRLDERWSFAQRMARRNQ